MAAVGQSENDLTDEERTCFISQVILSLRKDFVYFKHAPQDHLCGEPMVGAAKFALRGTYVRADRNVGVIPDTKNPPSVRQHARRVLQVSGRWGEAFLPSCAKMPQAGRIRKEPPRPGVPCGFFFWYFSSKKRRKVHP